MAVLLELDDISTLKEKQTMALKAFLSEKMFFFNPLRLQKELIRT